MKKILSALAVFFWIFGVAQSDLKVYAETNEELAQHKYNEGFEFLKKGVYQVAIVRFSESIQLAPNEYKTYHLRGLAYLAVKNYNQAIKDFSKSIKLAPDFELSYYNRGLSYFYLEKYNSAIKDFSKSIELKPDDVDAYIYRGNSYASIPLPYSKMTIDNILKIYEMTKKFDSDKLKYYLKAINDYNKAIEIDQSNSDAYFYRGSMYLILRHTELAIKDFDKAIELNPNKAIAYSSRGYCYIDLGETEKAKEDFLKAKKLGY